MQHLSSAVAFTFGCSFAFHEESSWNLVKAGFGDWERGNTDWLYWQETKGG